MNVAALRAFWRARSSREQHVLAGGLIALIALCAYGFLWRPMHADLARLGDELPRLRAQAMQTKLAAEEIARLRAKPPAGVINRTEVTPLVVRLASNHHLPKPSVNEEAGTGRVTVVFDRVNVDQWMQWIDELHRVHRIALVRARLDALDAPGMARAESELGIAASAR